jgi:hypothetical protein
MVRELPASRNFPVVPLSGKLSPSNMSPCGAKAVHVPAGGSEK